MASLIEITYYAHTGYNPSDEPASDAVIDLNEHWAMPELLKEYDPGNLHLQALKVHLTDDELLRVDYLKARDTVTNKRWYYFVAGHQRINSRVVALKLIPDAFATVGLENIAFFGNVARRSLSEMERLEYPLLPEPWAPRRPLKVRRMIIDLNVNKTIKLPSHISTTFEEEISRIEHDPNPVTIDVPNSIFGVTTFEDSLSFSADIPMGYPNAAEDTTHTINTPWGAISYTTPYEQYLTLSGTALVTFLEKAKKYHALDLVEPPYYVPSPASTQSITLSELSNPSTRNPKASRHYTTITIRSLASNSTRTFSDSDTALQYNQSLTVVIAPDKSGGIYVIPTTLRDVGLNAYTYLEGVYSPFETIVYNAVGDTPAKFAADGTTLLNKALNGLLQTYTQKINAMQLQNMQAKYFKDMGAIKGVVLPFAAELLGSISETITKVESFIQEAVTDTAIPDIVTASEQTQNVPRFSQQLEQTLNTLAHATTQSSSSTAPNVNVSQTSDTSIPGVKTIVGAYEQNTQPYSTRTTSSSTQSTQGSTSSTTINTPNVTQNMTGLSITPEHTIRTDSTTSTPGYDQHATQKISNPEHTTWSTTTQHGAGRSVKEGNDIAVDGIEDVYEITKDFVENVGGTAWSALKTVVFNGYRNEVHSFMLGNINDYLTRWVSIENDIHNGKVANLFKNITLVGSHNDYNKLAGKYEIVIASLQPEDEMNFDLFLDHFGHAVDEYTNTLVSDVRDNYNYTMVGEDAILANNVKQDASAQILNQFRTGVRVWKKLIQPENY